MTRIAKNGTHKKKKPIINGIYSKVKGIVSSMSDSVKE